MLIFLFQYISSSPESHTYLSAETTWACVGLML